MRKRKRVFWVLPILAILFTLMAGGCGGGGDGEGGGTKGKAGNVGILSAKTPDLQADAYGYIEVEAVLESDADVEAPGLAVVLYATPSGGGEEELLASVFPKSLSAGSQTYWLTLEVAAFGGDLEPLKTGEYINARLVLVKGANCALTVSEPSGTKIGAVSYRSAGDAPVVVKDSLTLDVKDPPKVTGAGEANALVDEEKGWSRVVAGMMNGEPVVLAWTAVVDVRMELACNSQDVEALEISENGGALLVNGEGTPVKTLRWEGPFQSGEVGKSFEVMYWNKNDITPPDIGTLAFTVRPVRAAGSGTRRAAFDALSVRDETLYQVRARITARESAARAAAEVEKMTYQEFASMVWQLWNEYSLNSKNWDSAVGPAYWYAHLPRDLSTLVDWSTAAAQYDGLAGVNMKNDFFSADRPINFWDSSKSRNHFIRVPKVYADAESKYMALYNASGTFPFGDEAYLKWWVTQEPWMMQEAIFTQPARDYGSLKIGDLKDDDYLWEAAFPKFLMVATSFGTGSMEYALFWHNTLGVQDADANEPAPSQTRAWYQSLFPTAAVTPIDPTMPGGTTASLPDLSKILPVHFDYGKTPYNEQYIQYSNAVEYSKSLGDGSKYFNAGYVFKYDDGIRLELAKAGDQHTLTSLAWTSISAETPVKILSLKVPTPFSAKADFSGKIWQKATYKPTSATPVAWENVTDPALLTDSSIAVTLELFETTLFAQDIDFEFSTTIKAKVEDLPDVKYPLISKVFEKAVVDPAMSKTSVFGVEISVGFGISGEAGLDFVYNHGWLNAPAGTAYIVYSKPVGLRLALEPNANLGAYASFSVGAPMNITKGSVFEITVKGETTLIELRLPLSNSRRWEFRAEKVTMGNTGPIPEAGGKWYYNLGSEKSYGLDLYLGGLNGKLSLDLKSPVFSKGWPLYEWGGITYFKQSLLNSSHALPLSIAAD